MTNLMKLASDLRYVNQGAILLRSSENERIAWGGTPDSENTENERAITVVSLKPKKNYSFNNDGTVNILNGSIYIDNGDGTLTLNYRFRDNNDGSIALIG